jgi:HPr kinase/phosphorylase
MDPETETILHATAVCVGTRAVLIRGASGSGKSALALEMLARGARLVSDDRVILQLGAQGILLSAPKPIRGMIEARGVGLLQAEAVDSAMLACVVDLDVTERERLPQVRDTLLLGVTVPLLHNVANPYFAAALIQYLRGGRQA